MSVKLVQVVSPAHSATGGPESLHNLVGLARRMGCSAHIVYHPYGQTDAVPKAYLKYDTPVGSLRDEPDVLIIFPETLCMEALRIRRATAAIWWLSLDNFALIKYHSVHDEFRYLRSALRGKRPLFGVRGMKRLLHLSKSRYDGDYLTQRGIKHHPLAGPISDFYLRPVTAEQYRAKENLILYNPRKDQRVAPQLRARFPGYRFAPLSGLDEQGLRTSYLAAKLYIDFGNHPGKERMPREAVACGCCVVTGRRGSAANPVDIPVPERFKLDETDPDFFGRFERVATEVFDDFPQAATEFEHYRSVVYGEPDAQAADLAGIIRMLA
jgi:hypothetical protein